MNLIAYILLSRASPDRASSNVFSGFVISSKRGRSHFFLRKKERKKKTLMVQSVLILFALGPQSKEELSIAAAVANESAGKIESGGPSCHPLGDGFKTRH